jgi:hypothetical protein
MSYSESLGAGDLVVPTDGYNGGYGSYSGGDETLDNLAALPKRFLEFMDFRSVMSNNVTSGNRWMGGLLVILVILLIAFVMWDKITELQHRFSSFQNGHPNRLPFGGGHSQPSLDGFRQSDRAREWYDKRSSFMNGRDAPYYGGVTNRVLRMEDREKEAVRALGKINQERMRRSAEDSSSTNPLPWGPFWDEWKQTHAMDGEDVAEGFDNPFSHIEKNPY